MIFPIFDYNKFPIQCCIRRSEGITKSFARHEKKWRHQNTNKKKMNSINFPFLCDSCYPVASSYCLIENTLWFQVYICASRTPPNWEREGEREQSAYYNISYPVSVGFCHDVTKNRREIVFCLQPNFRSSYPLDENPGKRSWSTFFPISPCVYYSKWVGLVRLCHYKCFLLLFCFQRLLWQYQQRWHLTKHIINNNINRTKSLRFLLFHLIWFG